MLKRYATIQLHQEHTRYMQVPGSGHSLEVDSMYVPLKLSSGDERLSDDVLLHRDERFGARYRVIGDPGSGKTSLTKKLFRQTCRGASLGQATSTLPVLLELKSLRPPRQGSERELGQWLLEQVRSAVIETEGFDTEGLFRSFYSDAGLTVYLDGLDEVATADYPWVRSAINGLSSLLARNSHRSSIFLTMRSQFHALVHGDFDDSFPRVLSIDPFSPSDIFEFLSRHPASRARPGEVTRMYGDLTDRPTLREMCRSPLVLAMYVARDQAEASGSVPDSRTSFYDVVTEELLVTRRSRQLRTTARTTLREQREAVLGFLALENLIDTESPANSIRYSTALKAIRRILSLENDEQAEDKLHEVIRDTGLLSVERDGESLRFIHLTFCEFLAAKEVAQGRRNGWKVLLQAHRMWLSAGGPAASRLLEVLPFAVALLPRVDRPEALQQVIVELRDPRTIARCLLETQLYGRDVLDEYIRGELQFLSGRAENEWDAEWRDRLHLLMVVLEDAIGLGLEVLPPDDIFQRLVRGSESRLLRLFTTYAQHDAAAAFRLAESFGVDLSLQAETLVLHNAANRPFLAILAEKVTGSDASERWTSLLACAGLSNPAAALQMMHLPASPRWTQTGTKESERRRRGWSHLVAMYKRDADPMWTKGPLDIFIPERELARQSTLYTQCLEIATSTAYEPKSLDPALVERLKLIRAVKPPDRLLQAPIIRLLWALTVSVVFLVATNEMDEVTDSLPLWQRAVASLTVSFPLIGLLLPGVIYPRRRDEMYLLACGVPRWTQIIRPPTQRRGFPVIVAWFHPELARLVRAFGVPTNPGFSSLRPLETRDDG